MGCLELVKDENKGKIIEMSGNEGKKNNKSNKRADNQEDGVINSKKKFNWSIVSNICAVITCFGMVLGCFRYIESRFDKLDAKVDQCLTSDDIKDLTEDVSEMKEYLYADGGVKDQLGELSDSMDSVTELLNITAIKANVTTEEYINSVVSVVENATDPVTSSFVDDTCIGTDADGRACIAKDLIGQTILLTFSQDDKEVYFLGQYNDNYHWDGYCVVNTYDANGLLLSINESNFDDGDRLNYESFYLSDNQDEWIYTDRDCRENSNDGISIRYALSYNKQKNFTSTNARVSDIVYTDTLKSYDKKILSYYDGATSNGVYNDDSGNAYLIEYNEDGFVNVFYKGCFKDGSFDDTNATEVVLDDTSGINKYFLYQGGFVDGKRQNDNVRYVTQSEIDAIVEKSGCVNDLKWYQETTN